MISDRTNFEKLLPNMLYKNILKLYKSHVFKIMNKKSTNDVGALVEFYQSNSRLSFLFSFNFLKNDGVSPVTFLN